VVMLILDCVFWLILYALLCISMIFSLGSLEKVSVMTWQNSYVTNFIWPYLHQFLNNFHSLIGAGEPLEGYFD